MSTAELQRVLSLPAAERLELIGQLWDSLVTEDFSPTLSAAQMQELDRRLDDLEQNGSQGIPWEEARKRIESSISPR